MSKSLGCLVDRFVIEAVLRAWKYEMLSHEVKEPFPRRADGVSYDYLKEACTVDDMFKDGHNIRQETLI